MSQKTTTFRYGKKNSLINKKLTFIASLCAISAIVLLLIIGVRHELPAFAELSDTSSVLNINSLSAEESARLNGEHTVSYYNGVYQGNFVAGLRDGYGVFSYNTGDVYQGYYQDDVRSGEGKITYADGSVLTGYFANDKANGDCVMLYSNGDKYEGEYRNGLMNGEGTYTYVDGTVYTGKFSQGRLEGTGKVIYTNGDVYEGTMVNGVCQGDGKITYENGDTYTGTFVSNKPDGYGVYQYSDGSVYKGQFVAGVQTDTDCYYKFADGEGGYSIYEGEIVNGILHGKGKLTYSNGDWVKGTFVNGKIDGKADYYQEIYGLTREVVYSKGKLISD